MRVLFNVIPEKGHINPYIGPAQHLQRRGHEVAFTAAADIRPQLGRAGLHTFLGSSELPPPPSASRGAEFARQVRDPQVLRGWIRELIVDRVADQVEPLTELVRRWRPDAIVTDPMVYASAIVAERQGLPWAAVSNSLNPVLPDDMHSELLDTVAELADERTALMLRFRVAARFRGCDMLSPHLTIAFATEAFVGREVPGVHLVGPSLPLADRGDECDFPWHSLRSDVPLVFMSLGSQIYYQPRMFRTVVQALADADVQLVLSVSELFDTPELGPLPNNVLAVRYAPQLPLLKRATAIVTHGGANSVMEALHAGVPMLISPLCNDQFHQARFIEHSDVGLTLDLTTAEPAVCRQAIERLLSPGPIRDRMRHVSATYQVDGAAEAARLIERSLTL